MVGCWILYIHERKLVGWLLEVYDLATSKVISGWLPTCDSTLIVTI